MARVKRGKTSNKKHKKILKAAKGYIGRRKNTIRVAKQSVERSLQYSYRDRRRKKRNFRSLWITRINAAARLHGLTYSELISKLKQNNIELNRKVLADLAMNNPTAFAQIIKTIK